MPKILNYVFVLVFIKIIQSSPVCIEGDNHCLNCNPVTKLCYKCELDIYTPDEYGGCNYSKKCIVGENQCLECNEEGNFCNKCIDGLFPDENGGCSYTNNCEKSFDGYCIECKEGFILVGKGYNFNDGIKVCKSLNIGDLKNCEEINTERGICEKCKIGYYLTKKDNRCTNVEDCFESTLGTCKKCINNYYLDKKEEKCKLQNDNFQHCKITIDGKICDTCDDGYFFDDYNNCIQINYCSKSLNYYTCEKCKSGYYLSSYGNSCVNTENCNHGNKEIGICINCIDNYYIDYKDGKCKTNQDDNNFKYCKVSDEECNECIKGYYIGDDHKCSKTKNCAEAENGSCIGCIDNYYLGYDNLCSNVEHCIYSNGYSCQECEEGYFYWGNEKLCEVAEGNLTNCLFSFGGVYCQLCKKDYYINLTDTLCYENNYTDGDPFYKCIMTNHNATHCLTCSEGYYLGTKDYKCTKIEGCILSENENKCLECNEDFCLDIKKGTCEYNDYIDFEEKKFYYKCNITNEEGNACDICLEGYELKNGLCVNNENCDEINDEGNCMRCQNDDSSTYCLNNYFGCQRIYRNNKCLECNDILDFSNCTKCVDGYENDEYGRCIKINDN